VITTKLNTGTEEHRELTRLLRANMAPAMGAVSLATGHPVKFIAVVIEEPHIDVEGELLVTITSNLPTNFGAELLAAAGDMARKMRTEAGG
jgi:hypothetical protein